MIVPPGFSLPVCSASSIIALPTRSFTLPAGLKSSSLAKRFTPSGRPICDSFTVGVYNVAEKKYYANTFSGSFEIVSLTGTINTMNGEFYTHLHMSAGNDKGEVFGGHLNRAVVSATCEMVVDVLDGTVDRQYDPVTGLNLFKF